MSDPTYHDLLAASPDWGRVGVLSWDSDVFGFLVATYQPGEPSSVFENLRPIHTALQEWAVGNRVELIGCSTSAHEPRWRALLPRLGFVHVDSTLTYTMPKLQRTKFPRSYAVRLATPADQASVEQIAEQAFNAGRYHADVRFPRTLANLRFRRWLSQAFAEAGPDSRVYVIGESGAARAFTHSTVEGDRAYITIGGALMDLQGHGAGAAIFLGTVEALRDSGIRRAQSKLSASNTPMMNLAAFAGSRFSDPQDVFHWHAADAPHLLESGKLPS
ncbi:MAG: GNAT family N-acetyltransferase [Verrucomicrobiota bacterium]|nr:GNAT family N-acetyltransferase [Verrucomicrobiota bacterium]